MQDDYIFISYSREDTDEVFLIVEELKALGATCWIDHTGVESGAGVTSSLRNAIEHAKVFLFMLSDKSVNSEWAMDELEEAKEDNVKVVPIVLKDVKLKKEDASEGMKDFLFKNRRFDRIDYYEPYQKDKLFINLRTWLNLKERSSENYKIHIDHLQIQRLREELLSKLSLIASSDSVYESFKEVFSKDLGCAIARKIKDTVSDIKNHPKEDVLVIARSNVNDIIKSSVSSLVAGYKDKTVEYVNSAICLGLRDVQEYVREIAKEIGLSKKIQVSLSVTHLVKTELEIDCSEIIEGIDRLLNNKNSNVWLGTGAMAIGILSFPVITLMGYMATKFYKMLTDNSCTEELDGDKLTDMYNMCCAKLEETSTSISKKIIASIDEKEEIRESINSYISNLIANYKTKLTEFGILE